MGTRALIHFKDEGKIFVTIYNQFDGGPSNLGQRIKSILGDRTLKDFSALGFNGIGCAAALLIGGLKGDKWGNVYIVSPDSSDIGEQYVYTISLDSVDLRLKIQDPTYIIYNGLLSNFWAEGDV